MICGRIKIELQASATGTSLKWLHCLAVHQSRFREEYSCHYAKIFYIYTSLEAPRKLLPLNQLPFGDFQVRPQSVNPCPHIWLSSRSFVLEELKQRWAAHVQRISALKCTVSTSISSAGPLT